VKIIKQAIIFLVGNEIRKISSTLSDDEGRSGEGPTQDLIIGLLRLADKTHNLA
jgi:hypothetical protein